MAARTRGARAPRPAIDHALGLVGAVRPAPLAVEDAGRRYTPEIAVWVAPDSGLIWGMHLGPPGRGAATLLEALLAPGPPPFPPDRALPGRLVLADAPLARQLRAMLPDPRIEVTVTPPLPEFDALFASLFEELEHQHRPTLALPDAVLAPLCAACVQLWRAKPWQFVDDEPPIEIRPPPSCPPDTEARPAPAPAPRPAPAVYACVLGAAREVFGVALYASRADYARVRAAAPWARPAGPATPDAVLARLRRRALLVSFDPKAELQPAYRAQLARAGWPPRLPMVPTFVALGGGAAPGEPTVAEARRAALAVAALVAFCERHEDAIAAAAFPIADTVAIRHAGATVPVTLAMPPGPGRGARRPGR
jgi:hypothetical protein